MKKWFLPILALAVLLFSPTAIAAAFTGPAPGELPTRPYSSYTYYSEIPGILADIAARSSRMTYEVIGKSVWGNDMWLAKIEGPWASKADEARNDRFLELRSEDPAAARKMLARGGDLRIPVFVNCSLEGDESTGTDAGLRVLKQLAFSNDPQTMRILKNDIVLVNVCENPDARIADWKTFNANGFDLNRDNHTQSQPEAIAVTQQIAKWKPTVLVDLHGYHARMLIDPCTKPHNPSYEWDLAIKWELPLALAQEKAVTSNTPVQVDIAYRDLTEGWEDYQPEYVAQWAMFYGLSAQTIETTTKSDTGVDADYFCVMETADFAAGNRVAMLNDHLERYLRALRGESQPATADVPNPITYPFAYVMPVDSRLQSDPQAVRRTVRYLVRNDIIVERARTAFRADGKTYPAGSYIVPLRQPLRGLANTLLWYGEDISSYVSIVYDVAGWNLPELWGFDRVAVANPFDTHSTRVMRAKDPAGMVHGGGPAFALADSCNNAVKAANELSKEGYSVKFVTSPTHSLPLGTFVVQAPRQKLERLAHDYHIDFTSTHTGGATLKTIVPLKIAVGPELNRYQMGEIGSSPTVFVLRQLGFDATEVTKTTTDFSGYDLVVNASSVLDPVAIESFVTAGGSYISIGTGGATGDLGKLLPITAFWTDYSKNSAIAGTSFSQDSLITAGYPAKGWTFAFQPTWFTGIGSGVTVDASYDPGSFILAGFWTGLPVPGDAAGQAAIVSGTHNGGRVVYIGVQPIFRAHTEHTFRLLSNAVYSCMK